MIRLGDAVQHHHALAHHFLGGGKGAQNGGGGGAFGAYQIDLGGGVARTALEIAIGGSHGHTVGGRGLANGAAGAAGNLQKANTGIDQQIDIAIAQQLLIGLARSNGTGAGNILVHMAAAEHLGSFGNIRIAGIGARANEHLLHLLFGHGGQRQHIVGQVRAGHHGHQLAHIQTNHFIVFGIGIGQQLGVGIGTALPFQKALYLLVSREDRRGGAHFRAHVGNGGALGNLQRFCAGAYIFIHLAKAALYGFAAQHFQHHFLGVHAGG